MDETENEWTNDLRRAFHASEVVKATAAHTKHRWVLFLKYRSDKSLGVYIQCDNKLTDRLFSQDLASLPADLLLDFFFDELEETQVQRHLVTNHFCRQLMLSGTMWGLDMSMTVVFDLWWDLRQQLFFLVRFVREGVCVFDMDDTLLYYKTEEADPFLPASTLEQLTRLSRAIPLFIISFNPSARKIAKELEFGHLMTRIFSARVRDDSTDRYLMFDKVMRHMGDDAGFRAKQPDADESPLCFYFDDLMSNIENLHSKYPHVTYTLVKDARRMPAYLDRVFPFVFAAAAEFRRQKRQKRKHERATTLTVSQ